MKAFPLTPEKARRALERWSGVVVSNGLDDGFFRQVLESWSDTDLKRMLINESGHLSPFFSQLLWTQQRVRVRGVGSWTDEASEQFPISERLSKSVSNFVRALISPEGEAWLQQLRAIEARHFMLITEKQLERGASGWQKNVFDLLPQHLSTPDLTLEEEVRDLLSRDCLIIGYAFEEKVSVFSGKHKDLSFSSAPALDDYPRIEKGLGRFQKEATVILWDYQHWLDENSVTEYTSAIKNGLLMSLPVVAIAVLIDTYGIPWLEEYNIEALEPVRKALEVLIRYVTGGAATLFIWLNLEGGPRKAVRAIFRRGEPSSQARTVYRAAAAGTLIGPIAVVLAKVFGLGDTTPFYAVIAMLAASADNLIGAFTQLNLRLLVSTSQRLMGRIRSALSHPFFVASMGAITLLTLLDAALRVITGGQFFRLLYAMGLEGVVMGVGDTFLIFIVLSSLQVVKINQLMRRKEQAVARV